LIVDDNATARRISRDAISAEGASVDEAADVGTGLTMLREALGGVPYDGVVLDHLMPHRDGFDFAKSVTTDFDLAGTRMLMLTSSVATSGLDAARELGIGGHLAKPTSRADLIRALGVLIGQGPTLGRERRLITSETMSRVGSSVRVLLAEDNRTNQQVAVGALKKRGYLVDVVGDGMQAVEAAKKNQYDVILMDLQMPVMDGLEATRQIRVLPGMAELPIIALTAHAFQEERERTTAAGMNGFLSKPFKSEDLYDVVDRWASTGKVVVGVGAETGDDGEPPDSSPSLGVRRLDPDA
jgi:CheY-like chemotaxis protein